VSSAVPPELGGRYEIGELLGRGGMAEVHIGHDTRLGRTVAVKMLRPDLARDPTFQVRFRREAHSAASLNHPAVVAVYDTGEDQFAGNPVPYIVMEYVEGSTLRDLLTSGSRLVPERALEIVDGVLEALAYSHQQGIVHRDIKPANVMLTRAGEVKVMDFGIARAMDDMGATMTQTSAVIGTPRSPSAVFNAAWNGSRLSEARSALALSPSSGDGARTSGTTASGKLAASPETAPAAPAARPSTSSASAPTNTSSPSRR